MKRVIFFVFALCASLGAFPQEKIVYTLDQCRALALENNTAVRNASLDEIAARAKKKEVATNWFPKVQAVGVAFHSYDYQIKAGVVDILGRNEFGYNVQSMWIDAAPEIGAGSTTFNFLKYGQLYNAVAIQPVFMGGQIFNGNKYAALGIRAALIKKSITKREVLQRVQEDYFKVTALQEKQKTLDALKTLLDSLQSVADIAYEQKLILKSDHMLLQTKKMELDNGRMKLRSGLKLLKMNLLSTMGVEYRVMDIDNFEFRAPGIEAVPAPKDVYMDEVRVAEQTEESRLLDLQVEAKKYEKKITFGSTLPSVAVGATYGWRKFFEGNSGRWNGMAFALVKVPISDWAANSFKMQQQQSAIRKACNDRDHLKEMLVLQQRQLYLELTSGWDALQLSSSQKDYAMYLYDQARLSYDAGMIKMTDLLQSYASLAQVQENWCNAVSDYLNALQAYTSRLPGDESVLK